MNTTLVIDVQNHCCPKENMTVMNGSSVKHNWPVIFIAAVQSGFSIRGRRGRPPIALACNIEKLSQKETAMKGLF